MLICYHMDIRQVAVGRTDAGETFPDNPTVLFVTDCAAD